jgi:RNase H-like domain found in reverse transcriptase
LGFTNFYRRFIQGFLDLARPMFDLTWKDSTWRWGEAEKSVFEAIQTCVISTPILVFPYETQPFRVEADSSNFATRAVLSQQSPEDDKWHPVAYYSKSLNAVERNYKIHDKEMLAVI